ncbi:MAG: chromate transporter [Lachnospiraceae bacterium]
MGKKKGLLRFFLSMGKVGCIGFGGGSILIPVIESEVVDRQKLDTKEQYNKDVVVASITPGALPVEIAGSFGRRNFGWPGMILGSLAIAFPGAFATVLLLTAFSLVQSEVLRFVEFMTIGVSAFIMLLLTQYIFSVQKKGWKGGRNQAVKTIGVMLLVFLLVGGKNIYQLLGLTQAPIVSVSTVQLLALVFFFAFYTRGTYSVKHLIVAAVLGGIYLAGSGIARELIPNAVLVMDELFMIGLAAYGFVSSLLKKKHDVTINKKSLVVDLSVWLLVVIVLGGFVALRYPEVIDYILKSGLSVLMSFGGGDAYLTIADGIFVESGMITAQQFYGQLVSVVNILPGSILCKTLTGIGYFMGQNVGHSMTAGILFAVVGFICSIAVSCGFVSTVYYLYDAFMQLNIFQTISKWIRPVIAGLLINIMISLCNQCVNLSEGLGIARSAIILGLLAGYAIDFIMAVRFKWNTMIVLAVNLLVTAGLAFFVMM